MEQRAKGFTLIELMIVVAMIAILASIAYTSYVRHVARMHRAQAQAYLLEVAQRQEQYFLDARTYAAQDTIFGLDPVPAQVSAQYRVTITAATPTTFVASAVPLAGSMQAASREPILSITQDGSRSPSEAWQ